MTDGQDISHNILPGKLLSIPQNLILEDHSSFCHLLCLSHSYCLGREETVREDTLEVVVSDGRMCGC